MSPRIPAPWLLVLVLVLAPSAPRAQIAPGSAPPPHASILFLTREQSSNSLTGGAEKGYFERLQLGEMRAKTGLALQGLTLEAAREATRAAYAESTQDFLPEERAALEAALQGVYGTLQTQAPLYARTPWSFIKVGARIEGGLPHTRGDSIVLCDELLARVAQAHAKAPVNGPAPVGLWNLMIHEQTHILQRRHPELFARLYAEVFGFRHVSLEQPPPWLLERSVINPDAPDADWVFPVGTDQAPHFILPYLVLNKLDQPRMPNDFDVVALDVEAHTGRWRFAAPAQPAALRELASEPDYGRAFPEHGEDFHPNEISAGLLAAIFSGSRRQNPDHELWAKTREWAATALQ